jgi:hypothetical protein
MKKTIILLVIGVLGLAACKKEGCTDNSSLQI